VSIERFAENTKTTDKKAPSRHGVRFARRVNASAFAVRQPRGKNVRNDYEHVDETCARVKVFFLKTHVLARTTAAFQRDVLCRVFAFVFETRRVRFCSCRRRRYRTCNATVAQTRCPVGKPVNKHGGVGEFDAHIVPDKSVTHLRRTGRTRRQNTPTPRTRRRPCSSCSSVRRCWVADTRWTGSRGGVRTAPGTRLEKKKPLDDDGKKTRDAVIR